MSRAVTPVLAVALLTLAVAAPLGATLFGAAAAGAAPACTITYTGGDVGDPLNWDLADNWDLGRVPGATDYACVPASFAGGTVSVGSGPSIKGVSVLDSAGLRLHNFGLTLTGTSTPSTINNIDLGQLATFTIDKGVTLTLTGKTGTAGESGVGAVAFAGAGTVKIAGTLGFAAGIQGSLLVQVDKGARVNLRSGYFDGAKHAEFVNYGTVVIAPPPSKGFVDNFGENSTPNLFYNAKGATLSDPAGAAQFDFGVPFRNDGTVSVTGKQTLDLSSGGGVSKGRFTVAAHRTLEFGGGSFDLRHATLTGSGTIDFQLGTISLGGQKLQHVAQCATVKGPFTVTKTWVSAACISNGEAVMLDRGSVKSTTTFARGSTASVGYGGYLVLAGHHRLTNGATLTDRNDICIADGAVLTNEHSIVGLIAPNKTTNRAIHPNCGLAGPEGRLVNAKGAVIRGKSATIDITTLFTNHGTLRGKVVH
jgi:hypothetical protein